MEHKITHGCAEIVYLLETGRAVNQDTFMSEYVVVFYGIYCCCYSLSLAEFEHVLFSIIPVESLSYGFPTKFCTGP